MKPTMTIRIDTLDLNYKDLTNIILVDFQIDGRVCLTDINKKDIYIKPSQIMHIWIN